MKKKINDNYLSFNENVQYFECGYSCDNALLLKIGHDKFFITDGRYTLEARENTKNTKVIESRDLIQAGIDILNKTKIKKLIYDCNQISVGSFEKLKGLIKPSITLESVSNFHQELRIIKTDEEISLIQKSQKFNKKAYKNFAKYLNKQNDFLNEKELFFYAKTFLQDFGKYDLSFEPILAINANAAKPHSLPTDKEFKRGDLLLFDAGIKYKRYCSDRTRTAYFGKEINFKKIQKFKNSKIQKIYDIVLKAQEKTIQSIKAGMKAKDIDKIARDIITQAGYGEYFVHSTGHGIGLDIHELPFISRNSDIAIENNMVFSIEPGIYIPDFCGVRIEDLVVVKDGKAEIL